MNKEEHFVYTQSTVDIKRSKFIVNSKWTGDIYHGDLVPLEVLEILPGDSFKYDVAAFIRTATPPIAPLMSKIQFSIAAFYVPKRLVWFKTKEFYGENTEGYGIQSEILEPRTTNDNISVSKSSAVGAYKRSLATYFGLVHQNAGSLSGKHSPIALNPIRAYLQCYNDWFRNENFHAPYLWDHSQTGDANRAIGSLGGGNITGQGQLPQVCKMLDKWTSALPWAQKGNPVLLPLGDIAPVAMLHQDTPYVADVAADTAFDVKNNYLIDKDAVGTKSNLYVSKDLGGGDYVAGAMVADLTAATAASVNELRLAFATQRYLEALARTGSKYREYIKGMFGVSIGDTTAQMAEYLGGMTIDLNIDQVLQQTGYAPGGTTTLGAPGASSTSASAGHLFVKSFDEPGYLVVVGYAKHVRSYGQGISELFQKHELFDYYNPKFANIGEIAMKENGIYFDGDVSKDNVRFGFQEAWQEYKHIPDRVVGALNPANSTSFDFWSLAEKFASAPTLNGDFLKEDRDNITRCLAGGSSSPDYFVDIKFNRTMVRPMPLYSIPGLIDHH